MQRADKHRPCADKQFSRESICCIRFLHIGVNPASPIPDVPAFCRWRDPEGNELILAYQQDYGTESLLPGGKVAISINFTGDNHGPHSYEQVKAIYADLQKRYPKAQLICASFNEIAEELLAIQESLPVVTSEIGDTWIYGYGGAPIRMAKFRTASALYSKWLKEGKLEQASDASLNFALELGLIAEHTQGMDIKTHLRNWNKYDMDKFLAARQTEPFRKVEASWREIDQYFESSLQYLPPALQQEAQAAFDAIDHPTQPRFSSASEPANGPWSLPLLGGKLKISGLLYQMYDSHDYDRYLEHYLRARYGWALDDLGKTGLDSSKAVSVSLPAQVIQRETHKKKRGTNFSMWNEGSLTYRFTVEWR